MIQGAGTSRDILRLADTHSFEQFIGPHDLKMFTLLSGSL